MMMDTTESTATDFVEFRLPLGIEGVLYNTGQYPVEISFDGQNVHKRLNPGREYAFKARQHRFHVRCSEPGETCPIYFRTSC